MIMQEVHVHVCVEVCSSLPLTSGIVLNIIFAPAMTSAMTWWSHAEKKIRSKALAQFLRYDAKKLRCVFIDTQGYVSIHVICNQLAQGSKRKDKGKDKRRRHFSWTPQDIEDVVPLLEDDVPPALAHLFYHNADEPVEGYLFTEPPSKLLHLSPQKVGVL